MTIQAMSKWIWFGLFVMTLAAIAYLGTRPSVAPSDSAKRPLESVPRRAETVDEPNVIASPPVPMTPSLVMPPEPSPYVDVPPNMPSSPDHPDYVPPPMVDGTLGDLPPPESYPPPPQAYPNPAFPSPGTDGDPNYFPQPFGENEPIPQYLQPTPGFNDETLDSLPPPSDEEE